MLELRKFLSVPFYLVGFSLFWISVAIIGGPRYANAIMRAQLIGVQMFKAEIEKQANAIRAKIAAMNKEQPK